MADISHQHLLNRAQRSLPSGPGAPRQADLRRGVSDAYYALFHRLTEAVALQTLRKVDQVAVQQFRRTLSHRNLVSACEKLVTGKGLPPKPLSIQAMRSPSVRSVAQSFFDLQQARHDADYDHADAFDAKRLAEALETAKRAIETIDSTRNDPAMCAFLSVLALQTDWAPQP